MTIFVDQLEAWGWILRGRAVHSCHMFTDSLDIEDLHLFAERIGMKRRWFQDHHVAPHYDLTKSRRDHALLLGAVSVDRRTASGIWRARREAIAAKSDDATLI